MADFNAAYAVTREHEGGYVNDRDDKGGETYKGIARNFHPDWPGWRIVDQKKKEKNFPMNLELVKDLQELVKQFYQARFWNALRLGEIQYQPIANELFDTAVNMGTVTAAKMVQEALNLSNRNQRDYPDLLIDGVLGHKTVFYINNHPKQDVLLKALNVFQGWRYIEICRKNPEQEKFFQGWFSRVSF